MKSLVLRAQFQMNTKYVKIRSKSLKMFSIKLHDILTKNRKHILRNQNLLKSRPDFRNRYYHRNSYMLIRYIYLREICVLTHNGCLQNITCVYSVISNVTKIEVKRKLKTSTSQMISIFAKKKSIVNFILQRKIKIHLSL